MPEKNDQRKPIENYINQNNENRQSNYSQCIPKTIPGASKTLTIFQKICLDESNKSYIKIKKFFLLKFRGKLSRSQRRYYII